MFHSFDRFATVGFVRMLRIGSGFDLFSSHAFLVHCTRATVSRRNHGRHGILTSDDVVVVVVVVVVAAGGRC